MKSWIEKFISEIFRIWHFVQMSSHGHCNKFTWNCASEIFLNHFTPYFLWFYIFIVLKHYHCLSRFELYFESDFHSAPHMSLSLRCEEPCMRPSRCPARCPCQNGGICQGRGVCLCPPGWMVRNLCIDCGFFCLFILCWTSIFSHSLSVSGYSVYWAVSTGPFWSKLC